MLIKFRLLITIVFSALISGNTFALPPGYEDHYHDGMRYGLFIPPSYDSARSYPLVIYLHGCSDTTSWDLQWYHDPIVTNDPCFVLTPKTFKYVSGCDAWGTSWYADHPEDMQNTLEVADSLIDALSIDTSRLYIYGTSMGGYGVFSVLAKEPGKFADAIAICGGGSPATASQVAQTPLWIFHGSADPVVPISQSKILYQAINGSSVQISWNSPSDKGNPDNQVWYYNILRDNIIIAEADYVDTVFLTLYSFNGQIVRTMDYSGLPAGKCEITVSLEGLADGIYLIRLKADDDLYTARLTISNQ